MASKLNRRRFLKSAAKGETSVTEKAIAKVASQGRAKLPK